VPITAQAALAQTKKLYEQIGHRRRAIHQAEGYYRGKQPLRFASDKWSEYNAQRYKDFSDNWCQPVANSPNERLRVTGFRLDDDPALSDEEKGLWRDWQANDMEAQSSQGLLSSIITGRSYVLVWGTPDDDPVSTWERADQVTIAYDPEQPGQPTAALKTWNDGEDEFATLFTADQVWKFERPYVDRKEPIFGMPTRAGEFFYTPSGILIPAVDAGGWTPRQPAGDDTWPLVNPMGMQDAINLLWAYLFAAADFASMPARVVMGQDPPKIPILDDTGQKVGERAVDLKKLAQDRILWLTGENSKIGQWDAAKLDVFTAVIETAVTHVAAQTRTPPHYMVLGKGLVNVSADGIQAAETGLVKKVEEMQLFLTPPVRGVFQRYALVRGSTGLADKAKFGVVEWKDAANHSEAQLVDALLKLQTIGFPFAWIAERYGLSQTEVERVMAMRETQQQQDPLTALVRQGGQPTPPAPPAGG
jgi:hypothetical protein